MQRFMTTFTRFYCLFLSPVLHYDHVLDLSDPPSVSNNCAPHMAIKTATTIPSFHSLGYRLRKLVRKSLLLTFMFSGQWLARVLYLRKQKISFHLQRRTWRRVNFSELYFPPCITTFRQEFLFREMALCASMRFVLFHCPPFPIWQIMVFSFALTIGHGRID